MLFFATWFAKICQKQFSALNIWHCKGFRAKTIFCTFWLLLQCRFPPQLLSSLFLGQELLLPLPICRKWGRLMKYEIKQICDAFLAQRLNQVNFNSALNSWLCNWNEICHSPSTIYIYKRCSSCWWNLTTLTDIPIQSLDFSISEIFQLMKTFHRFSAYILSRLWWPKIVGLNHNFNFCQKQCSPWCIYTQWPYWHLTHWLIAKENSLVNINIIPLSHHSTERL